MDFTGKLICQTYPRLIQIDTGSNTIQDGLGNIIHILPTTASYALTASYAVSASYEINYETSSSYADFAVSSSKAANAYWTESVDGSISRNSDVKITGSLKLQGDVTASGIISADTFVLNNQIAPFNEIFYLRKDQNSNSTFVIRNDDAGTSAFSEIAVSGMDGALHLYRFGNFNSGQYLKSSSLIESDGALSNGLGISVPGNGGFRILTNGNNQRLKVTSAGNTEITGSLEVTGSATILDALTIYGETKVSGNLLFGNAIIPPTHTNTDYKFIWLPNAASIGGDDADTYANVSLRSNWARTSNPPWDRYWVYAESGSAWNLTMGHGANLDEFVIERCPVANPGDELIGNRKTLLRINSSGSLFATGSTKFGNSATDIHQFTGSLNINNSGTALETVGSIYVGTNIMAGNSFYFPNQNLLMYPRTAINDDGNAYTFADANGTRFKQILASSLRISSGSDSQLLMELDSTGSLYVSGSTHFGNSATDIHQITGSMSHSGSTYIKSNILAISGSIPEIQLHNVDASGKTLNFFAGTAGVGFGTPLAPQQVYVIDAAPNEALKIDSNYLTIGSAVGITSTNQVLRIRGGGDGVVGYGTTVDGYNGSAWQAGLQVLHKAAGNVDAILVPSGGKVGIGITDPDANLEVSGSTHFGNSATDIHQFTGSLEVLGSISGSLIGTSSYADFAVSSSKAANAYWTESVDGSISRNGAGNVGIGTANPNAKLHVVGDTQITGSLKIQGTSSQNTEIFTVANENGNALFRTIVGWEPSNIYAWNAKPASWLVIGADYYNGANAVNRIDIISNNGTFIQGPLYPSSNVMMSRTGDAASIATQKGSYELRFQGSTFNQAAYSYTDKIYTTPSTTVSESHALVISLNVTGSTNVERLKIYNDGKTELTGSLDVSGSLNVGINNTTPHQIIGVLGINTYAPSKQVEINSGDGNNFRLTYNDNNGSPANYTDFLLNAVGALRIVSSNGNLILSGSVDVERGITGSLIGTASWAENSLTASYFATASITPSASYVNTSNLPESVKTIFANYTASINDKHLFVSSSSDLRMLLYPASSIQGKSLYIKLLDNVLFTIYPDGSDIIEFDTFLQMENKGISVELIPSGNNWFVI